MFNNKKISLLIILSVIIQHESFSQKFRNGVDEFGLMIGGSNYFGDIAPEIKLKETHLALGFLYKHHHSSYFSSRYQFAYGRISGDDKNFTSNAYRNINFYSDIFELGYNLEFNFLPYGINVHEKDKSPFVSLGLNIFMFNPKTKLPSGDPVSLRKFGTEGQHVNNKRKYALIQPNINLGLGYKIGFSKRFNMALEVGFRKTFTDYLDDTKDNYPSYAMLLAKQGATAAELSQPQTTVNNQVIDANTMRGDKHLKDWYFIMGITLSYRIVTTFCNKPF